MDNYQLTAFRLTLRLFAWVLGTVCMFTIMLTSKKNRKKVFRRVWYVLAAIMTVGGIATPIIALYYQSLYQGIYYSSIVGMFFTNEAVCYTFISGCYLCVFGFVTRKMSTRVKCILGAVASVLFVAEVFFINNSLRAIMSWGWFEYQGYSMWECFAYYAKEDLRYSLGLGLFRYVIVFLVQLALTACVIFIKSKKGEKLKNGVMYRVIVPVYNFFDQCDLFKLMSLYNNGKIRPETIFDYCNNMEYNERTMCDVLYCLNNGHENIYLYDLLFFRYKDILSRKQYLKYREKFSDGFDWDPIEDCRQLDEKFGVKYIGEYRDNYFKKDGENGNDEV